jgi:transcriptional regulator with XRE-family HTH domain
VDAHRIGRSLRVIRIRLGLRQADVAERATVSRSYVSKVERGLLGTTDFELVERLCRAVGADLDVRVRWRGEALDRLLDEAHADLVDATLRLLRAVGWEVAVEVTFNHFGDLGSVDILAWHAPARSLLVIEIKSVIADAQATLMPLDRKLRLAAEIGRGLGWVPSECSRLLVVRDTSANRQRVDRVASIFDVALPVRGKAVRRWLAEPAGVISALLFLRDATAGSATRRATGRQRVRGVEPARKAA